MTWYDLKKSFEQDLEDNRVEILNLEDEDEQREYISGMVDSSIPVETATLLEIALSDLWLAVEEPELMAFSGGNTAVGAIAGNIYQNLQEIGQEWLDKIKEK